MTPDDMRQRWCRRCFQPDEAELRALGQGDGCPLLLQAADGHTPPEWKRGKCSAFRKTPSPLAKPTADELPQGELFDQPEVQTRRLVPLTTWPDYAAEGRT
jgi:hypothetical protein